MRLMAAGRTCCGMAPRPNILVILTDQQRYPPPYESDELAAYRRAHLPGVERLRRNGVSFRHHYPMAAACAPSRASLLTGQYPSLHGVTQTDGISKDVSNADEMLWLAPDGVPTLGDWFRAAGYRTATATCCRSKRSRSGETHGTTSPSEASPPHRPHGVQLHMVDGAGVADRDRRSRLPVPIVAVT